MTLWVSPVSETLLSRLVQGPVPTLTGAKHWDSPVCELKPELKPKKPSSALSARNTRTPPVMASLEVMSKVASP